MLLKNLTTQVFSHVVEKLKFYCCRVRSHSGQGWRHAPSSAVATLTHGGNGVALVTEIPWEQGQSTSRGSEALTPLVLQLKHFPEQIT